MTTSSGQERRDALPRETVLRDYTIERVLGHGGFGIVYRARHNELGNRVAIKEYLPVELALREGASVHPRSAACRADYEDGLRRFRDEARALIDFQNHPSIVSCREFFRANGTAYLVMEYEEGLPLSQLLARREAAGRPFAEADLLAVMVPLLEGLARVHEAGALHRDIKPSNVLVRRSDERPVLIDFGAAKQMAAERSKSLAPYTEGYAALEQVGEGELGPWTDLYAAGAVMWRMVAGGKRPWEPPNPVKVEKRANAALRGGADPMPPARELGAGRFSPGALNAIDRCLQLNEKERVRDCRELLGLLRGAGERGPVPAAPAGTGPAPKPRKAPAAAVSTAAPEVGNGGMWRGMLTAAGVVLVAILGWLALAVWTESGETEERAAFRIEVEPTWATVKLLNSRVPYRAGMRLAPGRYEVMVFASGYETQREEVEHGELGTWLRIALEKAEAERTVPEAAADPPPRGDAPGGSPREPRSTALARAELQWEDVRETRDAGAARTYIEEYGGMEGAGVWVKLARSLLVELDREAREREARTAWERIQDTESEARLQEYIAQWERVAEAAEFVDEAREGLGDLERIRKEKEDAERKARELKQPGRRFQDCAECPQMVTIPAGSFLMGSPQNEEGRDDDEGPAHRVTLAEPFAVSAYEVTFVEWDACAAYGGCGGYRPDDWGWGRGNRPVINVSWEDAQAYVSWLRRKTGKEYRLLSEAEWEYAARAGTVTRYSFGDYLSPREANYGGTAGKTQPVGSYAPNGFGLCDMHGNAWEWVQDCWHNNYAGAPAGGRAWENGDCADRVLRGGSWYFISRDLRSARRFGNDAGSRLDYVGFRVARTLTP